jgi:hypothetical protein
MTRQLIEPTRADARSVGAEIFLRRNGVPVAIFPGCESFFNSLLFLLLLYQYKECKLKK